MPYTWLERYKIHQKAKRKLGIIKDEDSFMEECIQNVMDAGAASDESEAEAICEVLWDDIGGD